VSEQQMANHPSAEKRNRQRIKRAERARAVRAATRTAVKQARQALATGDTETAQEMALTAAVALAKAAKKGVIHPRTAARTTCRVSTALNKLLSADS
jgi:small subunit ribosomal protein S20